jgi:hypothetical protein
MNPATENEDGSSISQADTRQPQAVVLLFGEELARAGRCEISATRKDSSVAA